MKRHQGFTLIELLVSLTLGLVLITGAVLVFINNNRSAIQDEQISRLLENGRFVIRTLSRELAMAGFWGKFLEISEVDEHDSVVVAADCGDGATPWLMDLNALEFLDDADSTAVAAQFECIDSTTIAEGSDIIALKRVADAETADADVVADQLYLRTNGVAGSMYLGAGADTPPALVGTPGNWAYMPRIFYVRNYYLEEGDDLPALCHATLDPSAAGSMMTECLVDGVEQIQIEFGVDDDGDFVADYFIEAPSAAELNDAVSVRVYVLVRSVNSVPGYTNDKTYTLGNTVLAAFNDSYYRRVFNTTVVLRNPANLSGLGS
ncbi:MAG: PilW family protein [Pseudomonadota bacterium]